MTPFSLFEEAPEAGNGKQHYHSKTAENGFCESHRLSFEFLEIGAQLGYPWIEVPFKWKHETLRRTIRAGIGCWEDTAINTRRLQAAVDFVKRKYADQLREQATIS
jgi:hypothetical protein